MKRKNLLFFGIDTLRRDHMSLHGYKRTTTPHIDSYLANGGIVFDNCIAPSIPTTPGYASMMTGMDCFTTDVVALRHEGDMASGISTLAEILRVEGYTSTCVGFRGNVGGRGYDNYIDFDGWGNGADGRAHKAENLNDVTIPELERLAKQDKPFMLFLRHMDPHAPYRAPQPFERLFYNGNEFDTSNRSLKECYEFKPFRDFFLSWFPEGCTDAEYMIAQYDAEIAYMDVCINIILEKLKALGLEEDTLVVFTSDHGETLNEHDCYFDHHSLYEPTLVVPFAFKQAGQTKSMRVNELCQHKDIVPTILDIMGIKSKIKFDGKNLMPLTRGEMIKSESEIYITEATWMRKHGLRTLEWKLIIALEPDFHFKPQVELYNLAEDPLELNNVAEKEKDTVKYLTDRMNAHIKKREKATKRKNPMVIQSAKWNGFNKAFESSEEAYNSMHIGDTAAANKLQQKLKDIGVEI